MKFQLGESGNPNGRPKGTSQRQQLFNTLVVPHTKALLNTALELALGGNETMLRLFIERLLPIKAMYQPLEIMGNTARESISNILDHVAMGDLTVEDASKLASIIHKDVEINNQIIMLEKLTNLEQKLNDNAQQNINLIVNKVEKEDGR